MAVRINVELDLEKRIKLQQDRLRKMEFQHIGLLSIICQDNDEGMSTVDAGIQHLGRRIDLMDARVPIALSLDQQDLLLPAGLPVKLPDIIDPAAAARTSADDPIKTIPQLWKDRASAEVILNGDHYMVFRPVTKLVILRDSKRIPFADSIWPRVEFRPDHAGRHTLLLFDDVKNQAFFLYGQYQFSTALGRPRPIPSIAIAHA
jgi:hypothetical protein